MKAVVFERHGGPEVLEYKDVPEPVIGPNDVLIRIKASAANYLDIWARIGRPGMKVIMPHLSGSDAAGVVESVGSQVTGVKAGDEVMAHPGLSCRSCEQCTNGQEYFCRQYREWGFQTGPLEGAHAQYARLPAANVIPKPKSLSWEQAASIPLVLMTVWHMLVTRARIQPGDFVLVWGAAGGIGSIAIQVCKLFGAQAIAVVSSGEKLKRTLELGAAYGIDRTKEDVAARVREIAGRRGVDVVFEHVGQATFPTSVRSLRWGGTLVVCGATTGYEASVDLRFLWNKQLNLLGAHMGSKAELLQALRFVESGQIRPVVHAVLPMKEMARGQEMMEKDEAMGKVVYVPE